MRYISILGLVSLIFALVSCSSSSSSTAQKHGNYYLGGVKVTRLLIPNGRNGRWRTRRMIPRYITIHSTQNYSRSGNAYGHAKMLYHGSLKGSKNSLGYLTWHLTVDDRSCYQSLPFSEQGQHADYEGLGNRKSIGIEMCEHRGNSRARTVERTAKLCAGLMKRYNIPLRNVVPHQHWRMIRHADGRDLGHKNCPHFLMDNGRPGRKWASFQRMIQRHL